MRVVIIGGTGHVGTYLVPRLVEAGHVVINVSRGNSRPYQTHNAWNEVEQITLDRTGKESAYIFGKEIRSLRPDAVIDMICFTQKSAAQLAEALHGHIQHFLHCGTIWVHGHSTEVPATENKPKKIKVLILIKS